MFFNVVPPFFNSSLRVCQVPPAHRGSDLHNFSSLFRNSTLGGRLAPSPYFQNSLRTLGEAYDRAMIEAATSRAGTRIFQRLPFLTTGTSATFTVPEMLTTFRSASPVLSKK